MKSLKITLMLAVFCLTISGTVKSTEMTQKKETIQKIDKNEFKLLADLTKKTKRPVQDL